MKQIIKKIHNPKIKNIALVIISIFVLSNYFIVSLSFQSIGNNVLNPFQIIAFALGLVLTISLSVSAYLLYYKKMSLKLQTIIFFTMIIALCLTLIVVTCGTIGYLQVH